MTDRRISHLRSGGAGAKAATPGVTVKTGRNGPVYCLDQAAPAAATDPTAALRGELADQRAARRR